MFGIGDTLRWVFSQAREQAGVLKEQVDARMHLREDEETQKYTPHPLIFSTNTGRSLHFRSIWYGPLGVFRYSEQILLATPGWERRSDDTQECKEMKKLLEEMLTRAGKADGSYRAKLDTTAWRDISNFATSQSCGELYRIVNDPEVSNI